MREDNLVDLEELDLEDEGRVAGDHGRVAARTISVVTMSSRQFAFICNRIDGTETYGEMMSLAFSPSDIWGTPSSQPLRSKVSIELCLLITSDQNLITQLRD